MIDLPMTSISAMIKTPIVLTALAAMFGALPSALAEAGDPETGLPQLIRMAVEQNTEIKTAKARLDGAMARVPQARALPNPEVILETMGTDAVGAEQSVRLAQAFPWPGTLGQRESAASYQARARWHEVQAVELEVVARVRALAAGYAYLRKEADLIRRNLQLYRKQEDYLEQAARTGGAVPELLRVEMESGLLTDELAMVEESMARELAGLEALVGVPIPHGILEGLELVPVGKSLHDPASLVMALPLRNPTLQALGSRVEAARAGVEVARLETYPEFMVGAGYRRVVEPGMGGSRESMNEAVLMLSVSVPLWESKNRGIRDGAASELEMARQDYESALRLARAQLNILLSRARDAGRRAALFRDTLLPKAEQTHEAVEAAYRAGNASLPEVFDTRRRLLEIETGYWRALADWHMHQAELDALFGTEIQRESETL